MLSVTSDTDPVTNSTYYSYYQDYRNDANYWVNVTQMGSVSVSNGLALWNASGTYGPGVVSETHSYGMVLAALYNDKPTFDRLSATVQAGIQFGNSQNGSTGLFPWYWQLTAGASVSPNTSTIYSCSDSNSASDADINLGLAYLYADKAADVYGWSATPSQGGSSYETMATNYIQAIRQHDFSQTDTNLANRYVLAEGAAQATSGFGSNKFHYDYSDLRAYQLFEEYDPFLSANPQSTGESFWATAVTTTSTVWKALFDFGDTDPRVTENANTGLINAATNYVKLSNPTYGTLQAAFSDYTQVQASRDWTNYDSDAQRFPLRLLNYLDAKAAQGQTDSAMYGVAASNLFAMGTTYLDSIIPSPNSDQQTNPAYANPAYGLKSSLPIASTSWASAYNNGEFRTVQNYTGAGLLAWAGNDVLQSTNSTAAGIESTLLDSYSKSVWVGSKIDYAWTNPYNQYDSGNNPDGFNDSLTLWGLTVYDQGRTPLQLHMVQYDPSATVATVPGAPTSVVAVRGNASLAVTWVAPASNGDSNITDYLVKYSSNSGSTWTTFTDSVSTATSCTVTGLTNGTAYVIKVIAKNAVGISLPSANSAPVTPATVPGAPTSVVAVSGNASLAVTWVAPTSTGGSPITDYLVKYSSDGGSTWMRFFPASGQLITALSCTVTGLTNGTPYVIKVIANNAVGIGAPSTNSAPVTPSTVPGSPTSVVAVSGNGQLTVTWVAPASTGGSPITDYLVKYSSNGGYLGTKIFVRSGSTALSCTITGLTNGLPYVIKVIACNAVGNSFRSVNSAPATPATVAGAPTSVVAVSGNSQLAVTWVAPASNGGSPITEYLVKYSSNGGVAGSWTRYRPGAPITALSCTVTGLTNGTAYVIKVIARNAVGISLPSANSAPATPSGLLSVMRRAVIGVRPMGNLLNIGADGTAALDANLVNTSSIQNLGSISSASVPFLLPFNAQAGDWGTPSGLSGPAPGAQGQSQQQQSLWDVVTTGQNATQFADGMGSTLGTAYQQLAVETALDQTGNNTQWRGITSYYGSLDTALNYQYGLLDETGDAAKDLMGGKASTTQSGVTLNAVGLVSADQANVFGRHYAPALLTSGNPRPYMTRPYQPSSAINTQTFFNSTDYWGNRVNSQSWVGSIPTPPGNPSGPLVPPTIPPGGTPLENNPVFAGNGSFSYPSGHSVDGYAEPLVLALVYPERYQQLVTRGAEYGINRVVNGAHYTMDIIASRALAYHDIAQLMANDPDYMGINIKSNIADYTENPGTVGEFLNVTDFRALIPLARAESEAILAQQSGYSIQAAVALDTSRFSDKEDNRLLYDAAMNMGLPVVYPARVGSLIDFNNLGFADPRENEIGANAGYLLWTRFPYLSQAQRNDVLSSTDIEGGQFLDDSLTSFGAYSRIDLFEAADGYGSFQTNVSITMDASLGGFYASDTWANSIGGPGDFTLNGTGEMQFTGANTYSGSTTVAGGTLVVDGSLGAGFVFVASAATLTGSGSIGGAVAILDGGIVAPGSNPGTLTVNDAFTLADASILNFEFNAVNNAVGGGINDLIAGVTDLTLDGILKITGSNDWTNVADNTSWRVFNYSGTLIDNGLSIGVQPTLGAGQSLRISTATPGQVNLVIVRG